MIKENQRLLNHINVLSDGLWVFFSLLLSFWIRFYLLRGGEISLPFIYYVYLGLGLIPLYLCTIASFGLYESLRRIRLYRELGRLFWVCVLDMVLLQTVLFLLGNRAVNFSRGVLIIFFIFSLGGLTAKRIFLRQLLRHYRMRGYNQKNVLLVGDSAMAKKYAKAIVTDRELGYHLLGYLAADAAWDALPHLGNYSELGKVLETQRPDEVVAALPTDQFALTRTIIEACEKAGIKLSIIPFYAEYMPSNPQFDDVGGIPLMNIRRIPLDNWANAVAKRAIDIVGSLLLILVTSPVMLAAIIGVKLSSPGPVVFRQERVGRGKVPFRMYKFRSMRMNSQQNTGWSTDQDNRKTKFGAFIRKCSIDELPQFFNVLKGDMSLVGPRPEVPYYVEQFKEEIPLYMVKHQVRPGITGWAQVNGLRGDTSIKARIEHDVYYIEHWSILFDVKILFMTLFKGLINKEKLN